MQNRTTESYVAPEFSPPPYAVAVNMLFFASLSVVLVAAFLCMLVKGWIRELNRKLRGIPDLQKRAVVKELREQGLVRWRPPGTDHGPPIAHSPFPCPLLYWACSVPPACPQAPGVPYDLYIWDRCARLCTLDLYLRH
jgi:Family of unknown function (DUF6535)